VEPTPEILKTVREEARRRGVRWTAQRQVIVQTFLSSGEHITVDELHRRVREIDRTVSTATVYRTVNMLEKIGFAHRRDFGGASASFESALDKEHHDHLVCQVCGRITEFHHDRIEALQDEVAREHGFELSHHRMELYGVCASCLRQRAEARASNSAER
jgi:Fur family ferric uptake transcriptional regulator